MKSLWKKFIDWLMPKTRNEGKYTIDNDRLEKHMNLDLSHSVEGGETTLLDLAEKKQQNRR